MIGYEAKEGLNVETSIVSLINVVHGSFIVLSYIYLKNLLKGYLKTNFLTSV